MNQTQQYEKALTIIEICKLIGIPESRNSTLLSWEELEERYIEKIGDEEKAAACKNNAEELRDTINEENFCSVIEQIIFK